MEIAILTSSRADFGFYKPLLRLLKQQSKIKFKIVAFGTHLSKDYGYTLNEIKQEDYDTLVEVDATPKGDQPVDIAEMIGNTHIKFARFWNENQFDLIICIGDRYEMFAAVSASLPFNMLVAHISGGEETQGAIDNVYRHSMTLMAKYHFTNTQNNANRVREIIGSSKNIFYTGSLAIDNVKQTELYNADEFNSVFNFDISQPFILFTFHPETVDYKMNAVYADIIADVLINVKVRVLVTMPNADTMGGIIRQQLHHAAKANANIFLVESLGSKGYYTALEKCILVLGNSSSGIIEAASFSKYVINIGNRQLGREHGINIIHCGVAKVEIENSIKKVGTLPELDGANVYGDGYAADKIYKALEKINLDILNTV